MTGVGRGASDESIEQALALQSTGCAHLGSPLYSRLLDDLLNDFRTRGRTASVLGGRPERPVRDALPLRLLGAVHRIVLRGDAPSLAVHYPSADAYRPSEQPSIPVDRFLDVVDEFGEEVADELGRQVQTNEVGRSVVHLSLANWLGGLGLVEFDLLEIGASAGLNLNFDRFHAVTANGAMGRESSLVRFDEGWFDSPPALSTRQAACVERSGCDVSPLDATRPADALRLQSFVWPDQADRLARLRGAITIAETHPPSVVDMSADEFLAQRLPAPMQRTRLVFHSIVWQYLLPVVQDEVRRLIAEAGSRATDGTPLVWARMEPAGAVADVRATVFSGNGKAREYLLAEVGYHGQQLRWL